MWIVPQVTIYMDADTAARAKQAAKAEGISLSRWIVGLVRRKTEEEWPASIRELAGAWKDFPAADEIRAAGGTDTRREPL